MRRVRASLLSLACIPFLVACAGPEAQVHLHDPTFTHASLKQGRLGVLGVTASAEAGPLGAYLQGQIAEVIQQVLTRAREDIEVVSVETVRAMLGSDRHADLLLKLALPDRPERYENDLPEELAGLPYLVSLRISKNEVIRTHGEREGERKNDSEEYWRTGRHVEGVWHVTDLAQMKVVWIAAVAAQSAEERTEYHDRTTGVGIAFDILDTLTDSGDKAEQKFPPPPPLHSTLGPIYLGLVNSLPRGD